MKKLIPFLPLLLIVLLPLGCSEDDNPAGEDDSDHGHLEAVGVQLRLGSDVLVEADGTDVGGGLQLAVGDTSAWYEVWFLNPDSGTWMHPEADPDQDHGAEEEEYHLQVELESTVAEVLHGEDVPDQADPWTVRFIALEQGQATFRVTTLHGEHSDYVSPALPLSVSAAPR
jgi:hypothetical protein